MVQASHYCRKLVAYLLLFCSSCMNISQKKMNFAVLFPLRLENAIQLLQEQTLIIGSRWQHVVFLNV